MVIARVRVDRAVRARLYATRSQRERAAGRADTASAYLAQALALQPDRLAWRLDLLRSAAGTGDQGSFYRHFDKKALAGTDAAELAALFGELGQQCRGDRNWRAAADAFHHAHRLQPTNKLWKDEYVRLRRYAPDWGFYSPDPVRVWRMEEYPDAATRGLVAPIRQLVFGWIPASVTDSRVLFKLNGTVVAETTAVEPVTLPDGNEYLQFSRYLKDLWAYAGAGDALSVESNGHNLTIIGRGETFEFQKQSRSDELFEKLGGGFILNKYGRIKPSIRDDDSWQLGMFELYAKLRDDIKEAMDLTLIPFYGTMLGAIREQDFISHDNDFDTIYISPHSEPSAVREEFKALCNFLLSRGYDLKVKPTHTWVRLPGTPDKLDIFFGWFTPEGYFDASYGYHGTPVRRSPEFFEYRPESLGRQQIPVPRNGEAILSQLYGDNWRTPDPGFAHYSTSRKIDRRYRLSTADITELHWNQFYRDHQPDRASRFAEYLADRFGPGGVLIEFGCGAGRDGIYFANRGWTTFCCDRSPGAVARATEVLQASGGLPARFDVVDAADSGDVTAFLAGLTESVEAVERLVVYSRFFFHAIDEPTQNALLDAVTGTIERDFYLCAEFRTPQDRELAKVHGTHYRRYIDPGDLAELLRNRWGFEVQHVEAGQGLSPYDGEDPHLGRIIAFRGRRTTA